MRRDIVRLCQVVFQEFSGCIQDSVNKMFRWTFPPFGDFANRLVLELKVTRVSRVVMEVQAKVPNIIKYEP